MCYSHKHRAFKPKMNGIRKVDPRVHKSMMADIAEMQRLVCTEDEFVMVYDLVVAKYSSSNVGKYSKEMEEELQKFWAYHRQQWGPGSHVSNWWEGANPFNIGHNQGIERKNLQIKVEYSHRERLTIGEFVKMCETITEDESKRDDTLLNGKQTAFLEKDNDDNIKAQHHKISKAKKLRVV